MLQLSPYPSVRNRSLSGNDLAPAEDPSDGRDDTRPSLALLDLCSLNAHRECRSVSLLQSLALCLTLVFSGLLACESKAPSPQPAQPMAPPSPSPAQASEQSSAAELPEPGPEPAGPEPIGRQLTELFPSANTAMTACYEALAQRYVQPGGLARDHEGGLWLTLPESRPLSAMPIIPQGLACQPPPAGDSWLFPSDPPLLLVLSSSPTLHAFREAENCFAPVNFATPPPSLEKPVYAASLDPGRQKFVLELELFPELSGNEVITIWPGGVRIDRAETLGQEPELHIDHVLATATITVPTLHASSLVPVSAPNPNEPWQSVTPLARYHLDDSDTPHRSSSFELFVGPSGVFVRIDVRFGSNANGQANRALLELSAEGLLELWSEQVSQQSSGDQGQQAAQPMVNAAPIESVEEKVLSSHWKTPTGHLFRTQQSVLSSSQQRLSAYAKQAIYKDKPCNVKGFSDTKQRASQHDVRWFFSTYGGKALLLSRTDALGATKRFDLAKKLEFPTPAQVKQLSLEQRADLLASGSANETVELGWNRATIKDQAGKVMLDHSFDACDSYLKEPTSVQLSLELKVRPRGLDALEVQAERRFDLKTYGLEAELCVESASFTWLLGAEALNTRSAFEKTRAVAQGCDELQ